MAKCWQSIDACNEIVVRESSKAEEISNAFAGSSSNSSLFLLCRHSIDAEEALLACGDGFVCR